MKFEPLEPSDYGRLKKYFQGQPHRICAYSLASIIAWSNDNYKPYGAAINGSLFVCSEFAVDEDNRHLILPISPHREYTPEALCDLAAASGYQSYWFVPEDYIARYGRARIEERFVIAEQKEYMDYVYRTADLVGLQGNKYSKKRNLIHQFEKKYLRPGRVQVEKIASTAAAECIVFLEKWCEERDCDRNPDLDLACEKQAAINTITHADLLEVSGILVRVDGVVSALGIGTMLTADMGVLHFEKAFAHIKGLYQYLDRLCAKELLNGFAYVNKESDMNIPGLAKAKKSYHPVMMIKSYQLTVR